MTVKVQGLGCVIKFRVDVAFMCFYECLKLKSMGFA